MEREHRIKIGISACLLGKNVRYDGGHALDLYLTDTLGRNVDYVPVCPEVECGLSVPRECMHLAGSPDDYRLVTIETGKDMTDRVVRWAGRRVKQLDAESLDGFIFKSKSPSCGMKNVKVYAKNSALVWKGVGIFARAVMERFPLLPAEEDRGLHDPDLRENFIEQIFAHRRGNKDDG